MIPKASQSPDPDSFEELRDAPPIRRFRLSWTGWLGCGILGFVAVLATIGPWIAPYHEADILRFGGYTPPDAENLLGTDYLGRDVLSRIIWGARVTIGLSVLATILACILGIALGLLAAVRGGWTDVVLSRITDALLSIPNIMLGMLAVVALGSGMITLLLVASVIYATGVFRVARSLALDVCQLDFVVVARSRGERSGYIIVQEILPNIAAPLATDFGIRLVYVILFISSLSFLGLGVQPPAADWGSMVRENLSGLMRGSLSPMLPAIAIALVTISVNLVVDDVSARTEGRFAGKMI